MRTLPRRSLLAEVWRQRSRRPVGSAAWLRLWARRARHLPRLVALAGLVQSLRAGGAEVGERVALGGVTVSGPLRQLSIGDGTAIDGASLRLRGAIRIGRCVAINRGAVLLAGNHDANSPGWELVPLDIEIGDHAWIGTNAVIVGRCRIGTGAVVSAGAVVGVDVPDGAIAVGNPARVVGKRATDRYEYVPAERWPVWRAWLDLTFSDQLRLDDADIDQVTGGRHARGRWPW